MAVYRAPMTCPWCDAQIHFKYNPVIENFIGDQGGEYEQHTCKEDEIKRRPIITEEQRLALEKLSKKLSRKE